MKAAGLLNEIIELFAPHAIETASGSSNIEWESVGLYRANVRQMSSNRTEGINEILYDFRREIIVRYYVPVEEYYRVKYNNQWYNILSIDKDRVKQQITIVVERVND